MAEEEKDDWLDDLDESDDEASALDQSDIESLISGDDEDSGGEEDVGEIDSADIDSLLSGTDDQESQPVEADAVATPQEGDDDIDQSDIDALLSESDSADDEELTSAPDQNEIDMLFTEVEEGDAPEGDPFQAEEIDFKDVIDSDQGDDESFLDGTGTEFDADEFGLDDDMPDLTDLSSIEDSSALFDDAGQTTEGSSQATVLMSNGRSGKTGERLSVILASLPPALKNRKIQGIVGGCLVLLILAGVYLFGGEDKKPLEVAEQPTTHKQEIQPPQPTPAQQEQTNIPPVAENADLTFKESKELAIYLAAKDTDGDRLSYEVLSLPVYGKLSGQAPELMYTPGKDFSGHDSFMFRVSDGKSISQPAKVTISAPPVQVAAKQPSKAPQHIAPRQKTTKKKQVIKPKKLAIAAKTKNYQLNSTKSLVIDWEDIWSNANYLPFTSKVQVEIISNNLHGKIKQQSSGQSLYVPDKYYGGTENIKYRFKLGKTFSKIKELTINIKLGHPPPTIILAAMAPIYVPGETAIIDAQESLDEQRSSVKFTWQQVSGVPVQLKFLNEEKSRVAFVVPSSFNTVANPGPEIHLTVTDEDGQKDEREIKVATRSRRPSAMWRGLAGGGIADDPYCPYDNCPGGLLPWPYKE